MNKGRLLLVTGFAALTFAAMPLFADGGEPEPGALCCTTSVPDCTNPAYPQCYFVGADCDSQMTGQQGYCMADKAD